MSLSFADSLKKEQEQSAAKVVTVSTTLPVSADIATKPMTLEVVGDNNDIMIGTYSGDDGSWTEHNKYKHYSDYSDNNVSTIDDEKNIFLSEKQFNISQEENSQLIPFEMPRYYDGFDLTTTVLSVHYETSDKYHGASKPVNVTYNNEKIRFAWLVDAKATHIAGNIKFEIHATGVNSNGDAYVWKSKPINKLNVLESLCTNCENIISLDDSWVQELVTAVAENIAEQAEVHVEKYVIASQNAAVSAQEYAEQAQVAADKAESIFETVVDDILFVDGITGLTYRLYVYDKKLSMTEVDASSSAINTIKFLDQRTGSTYRLYVDNGELSMMELINV